MTQGANFTPIMGGGSPQTPLIMQGAKAEGKGLGWRPRARRGWKFLLFLDITKRTHKGKFFLNISHSYCICALPYMTWTYSKNMRLLGPRSWEEGQGEGGNSHFFLILQKGPTNKSFLFLNISCWNRNSALPHMGLTYPEKMRLLGPRSWEEGQEEGGNSHFFWILQKGPNNKSFLLLNMSCSNRNSALPHMSPTYPEKMSLLGPSSWEEIAHKQTYRRTDHRNSPPFSLASA